MKKTIKNTQEFMIYQIKNKYVLFFALLLPTFSYATPSLSELQAQINNDQFDTIVIGGIKEHAHEYSEKAWKLSGAHDLTINSEKEAAPDILADVFPLSSETKEYVKLHNQPKAPAFDKDDSLVLLEKLYGPGGAKHGKIKKIVFEHAGTFRTYNGAAGTIERLLKLLPPGGRIEFQSYFEPLRFSYDPIFQRRDFGFANNYEIDLPGYRNFPDRPYSFENGYGSCAKIAVPGLEIENLAADIGELALTEENKQYVSQRARIFDSKHNFVGWEEHGFIPKFQDWVKSLGIDHLTTSFASATAYMTNRDHTKVSGTAYENNYCAIVRGSKK